MKPELLVEEAQANQLQVLPSSPLTPAKAALAQRGSVEAVLPKPAAACQLAPLPWPSGHGGWQWCRKMALGGHPFVGVLPQALVVDPPLSSQC